MPATRESAGNWVSISTKPVANKLMYTVQSSFMSKDFNEEAISEEPMFETMFRWKQNWAAIIVKPTFNQGKFLHYIVKWVDGPTFFLWKNEFNVWEEMKKGSTERAKAAGKAIEDSCLVLSW